MSNINKLTVNCQNMLETLRDKSRAENDNDEERILAYNKELAVRAAGVVKVIRDMLGDQELDFEAYHSTWIENE